ncbi:MAG TPA: NAD-dependent epimerase/dehydratase family protein [Acidimicrobiia bacterium]|jgi:nucleoside-diphosphate-sugar epimerase|nr:NAD-dependent epimerase/dehydratase family protein [Acidimicrobiia bacterium]
MKALVVGGSQFNGFALVQELVRRGHDVTVLNRGRTEAPFPDGVTRITADRTDRDRMAEVLAGTEYDCVLDMCAYHPEDVEVMVELLRDRVGHYVFVSSTVIYARASILPITEESAVDRSDAQIEYGLHKLLCEDRLLAEFAASGFPATTVALSMVMGPRNIVPDREQRMFVRLLRRRPVLLLGRGRALGQIGDVDDQAAALCDVMGQPVTFGQRYNLTGGQYFTDEGYVDVFSAVVGAEVDKVFVSADVVDDVWHGRLELGLGRPTGAHIDIRTTAAEQRMQEMAIRQRYQLANLVQKLAPHLHHWDDSVVFGIDKLARDVGWRPRRTFRETVEKSYEWFMREGVADRVTFDFAFEDELLGHTKERERHG